MRLAVCEGTRAALQTENQSGSWHGRRLQPRRKPGPGLPGAGSVALVSAVPRRRKYRRAARPGCNGAQWSHVVRQQQPRALLEDTGLQSRPTTDGPTETVTGGPGGLTCLEIWPHPGAGAQWGNLGIAHVGARVDRGDAGRRGLRRGSD
jgi:hypothetical protein